MTYNIEQGGGSKYCLLEVCSQPFPLENSLARSESYWPASSYPNHFVFKIDYYWHLETEIWEAEK